MKKKHIISIGGDEFVVDSITAATQLANTLSKLKAVRHVTDGAVRDWHYTPKEDQWNRFGNIRLELNQPFKELPKPKPEPKALTLPKPKRGTILCICEKSYVAPRQSCPSCGRPFSDSHSRTHTKDTGPNLRLL